MEKLVRCKTKKEAKAVSNKLEKEARKLVELARKTPSAQIVCLGGGSVDGGIYGFQIGWVTNAERIRLLSAQIKDLNRQGREILLAEIKNLK